MRKSKSEAPPRLPPPPFDWFAACLRDHSGELVAFGATQHFTVGKGPGIVVVSATSREHYRYLRLPAARRLEQFPQLARELARYRPGKELLVLAVGSSMAVLFKLTPTRLGVHVDLLGGGDVRVCLRASHASATAPSLPAVTPASTSDARSARVAVAVRAIAPRLSSASATSRPAATVACTVGLRRATHARPPPGGPSNLRKCAVPNRFGLGDSTSLKAKTAKTRNQALFGEYSPPSRQRNWRNCQ